MGARSDMVPPYRANRATGIRRDGSVHSSHVYYALLSAGLLARLESAAVSLERFDHQRAVIGTIIAGDDRHPELGVDDKERNDLTGRLCPWCDSPEVRFVQRGYVGPTDEVDQYVVCAACNKITYEIVAKTAREMRLGRYKPGAVYQDRSQNTRYTINRVLRAGQNEFLIYLKPLPERAGAVL